MINEINKENETNEAGHFAVRISDIPKSQRPYERCMSFGPESLTDAELLGVVIRTGSRDLNSVALAEQILGHFKGREGLEGLLKLSFQELSTLKGIGPVKAVQIMCIAELSRRIWRAKAKKNLDFSSPESIADFYMESLRHRETECALCVYLNTKKQLISDFIISTGGLNETVIHPREVFLPAVQLHAAGLVLLHNHPSGNVTPSKADIAVTRRIYQAGNLLGIQLHDHLIIGDKQYYSMFDSQYWDQITEWRQPWPNGSA